MEPDTLEDDVYRISDVIRGAHSLVIAVGSQAGDIEGRTLTQSLLQQWGQRLWTLPEALLSTSHRPISVYRRGYHEPLVIPKKQFAAMAWTDSNITRQLIDHYEGNLSLSRLELVIIGMQCLFARKTSEWLQVSISYFFKH